MDREHIEWQDYRRAASAMTTTLTQRQRRDGFIESDPRPVAASLAGYAIETISRTDALPLILRYEWLGTLGKATYFVGLLSPERELQGVACFGHGPAGPIRDLVGSPALCLERGACVHYAPRNAASFLITAACKLVYRITGTEIFFAYADPSAGEYGGVYQAANWLYLGQGLDGRNGRSRRYMVLPPETDPGPPQNWRTTREFRRPGRPRLTFKQAKNLGWQIASREAKHVYAVNVGPRRRRWSRAITALPYPAPQPERKRLRDGPPLHLSKPVPVQADLFRSPPVVPNAAHTAEMPVTPEQLAETQQSDIAHFGEIVVR